MLLNINLPDDIKTRSFAASHVHISSAEHHDLCFNTELADCLPHLLPTRTGQAACLVL